MLPAGRKILISKGMSERAGTLQRGSSMDLKGSCLKIDLIYDLREINPDEDIFMHAFAYELDYVTVAVNNLLEEWELIVHTKRNGTYRL